MTPGCPGSPEPLLSDLSGRSGCPGSRPPGARGHPGRSLSSSDHPGCPGSWTPGCPGSSVSSSRPPPGARGWDPRVPGPCPVSFHVCPGARGCMPFSLLGPGARTPFVRVPGVAAVCNGHIFLGGIYTPFFHLQPQSSCKLFPPPLLTSWSLLSLNPSMDSC